MDTECSEPKKESPIEKAIDVLSKTINRAGDATEGLINDLHNVLSPAQPVNEAEKTQRATACGLEAQIYTMAELIGKVADRIQDTRKRVQL